MIAVRIGPDIRLVVVGLPEYFAKHSRFAAPHDLSAHNCISYRQATSGGLCAWEFEKDDQALSVRVSGSLVFNDADLLSAATLAGHGLSYFFEEEMKERIASGRLVQALEEWCPTFPGFIFITPIVDKRLRHSLQ